MPALKWLNLHQNKLTDIKELCRKEFGKLESLDLGTNKIREIPIAFVHYLSKINTLNLMNNDLDKLPFLLGFHSTLKQLSLEGNSLKTIRRPVIERGTDSIL